MSNTVYIYIYIYIHKKVYMYIFLNIFIFKYTGKRTGKKMLAKENGNFLKSTCNMEEPDRVLVFGRLVQ